MWPLSWQVSFFSCSKDSEVGPIGLEGPQGEQGIQGPEGPQGPAGQDGEELGVQGLQRPAGRDGADGQDGADGTNGQNGADGKDGNAEVLYSDWIPANFSGSSTTSKLIKISFPPVIPRASRIDNTHIVLVYFIRHGDGNAYLLPVLGFRGAQFTYGFGRANTGSEDIDIYAKSTSSNALSELAISPVRGNKFRYVIIPPNLKIGAKSKRSDFKKMTYEEDMDDFGLTHWNLF